MITKADEIKFLVMCYWRFSRQHHFVATEYNYGDADVVSMDMKKKVICQTEVKISVADLKREKKKHKHFKSRSGERLFNSKQFDFFYIAMPEELTQLDQVRLICDGAFPYAGILAVKPYEEYLANPRNVYTQKPPVECVKVPTKLSPFELRNDALVKMARGMSNSFCRLSFDIMRLQRGFK